MLYNKNVNCKVNVNLFTKTLHMKEVPIMTMYEYCGALDLSLLEFVFSMTDDIREKISQKKLFYKEQIMRYVHKRIDLFFKQQTVTNPLLQVYKFEVYNTIMFRVNNELKGQRAMLQCV